MLNSLKREIHQSFLLRAQIKEAWDDEIKVSGYL